MSILRTVSVGLAVGVAAIAASLPVAAAPFTLQFNGYVNSPPEPVQLTGITKSGIVNAGAFSFTITNVTPTDTFAVYCIELEQSLGNLITNYDTTSLASYFTGSVQKQTDIARLFSGGYTDSLTNATKSAAFQLALWEVIYDAAYNLGAGNFRATNPFSVITQANAYLAAIASTAINPSLNFTIYQSATNQDYIRVTVGRVSEPATALLLAGLGLVALAMRRRRQA